jgi:hypothetical protein
MYVIKGNIINVVVVSNIVYGIKHLYLFLFHEKNLLNAIGVVGGIN